MMELSTLRQISEDITFVQLRTFVCAAQAGSFIRAADMLGISQPAVSEQIRILEKHLGCLLFERRRGSTPILTPIGEEILADAEIALIASASLTKNVRSHSQKIRLRISTGPYLREKYLRPLIPRIYREYPDVELDIHSIDTSDEAVRMFESGALDLATFAMTLDEVPPAHTRQICELPFMLVAAPGTRAQIASGEKSLNDFQYIFPFRREAGGALLAKRCMLDLGLMPSSSPIYVQYVDVVVQMVEDGQGIGHLLAYSIADRIEAGTLEALDVELAPMRRLIARSPLAPPVASAIEDMLCAELSV